MATAQQLKTLIKSHFEEGGNRFITLSLQIAAHEAKLGHTALANDIRNLIDNSQPMIRQLKPLNRELEELILEVHADSKLSELIVSDVLKDRIQKILNEYRNSSKLLKYGLENRRKVLLSGPPGTGKTMTASIISKELGIPLYVILMDKIVTKFMGETSAKLRTVFNYIKENKGIYLFDEFDAIGGERGKDNDVGEMRRVVNSFLQFIEMDDSESIIVAATNNFKLLDQALFRRFDDVLLYNKPNEKEIKSLIDNRLANFKGKINLKNVLTHCEDLSHAEISKACFDAIKETVLSNNLKVSEGTLIAALKDRSHFYNKIL
ncbi:ATP-binding protein [Flavobacterium arcticum]|uniref:ATP-binding protein n=1 Tax=Flavobacterium arcticum TaxID=1784713 RepID=A0A345HB91_9FLAO|nr:AAA family ATPase [Flavobacterium arcticum]AXG73851.1 ATP-binding protein [Flavobacterium arcticum]KAF2511804.1 ATP-binding protein [Flavobacterium arcticum]